MSIKVFTNSKQYCRSMNNDCISQPLLIRKVQSIFRPSDFPPFLQWLTSLPFIRRRVRSFLPINPQRRPASALISLHEPSSVYNLWYPALRKVNGIPSSRGHPTFCAFFLIFICQLGSLTRYIVVLFKRCCRKRVWGTSISTALLCDGGSKVDTKKTFFCSWLSIISNLSKPLRTFSRLDKRLPCYTFPLQCPCWSHLR